VLFYLLYVIYIFYFDLGQGPIEFSPMESSLCRLYVVSGDGELAHSPAR
jgi:hypothetical protein